MKKNLIIPTILCGGSGSRLWPLSRQSFPKQFLSIGSAHNKSLLQNTQERILGLENLGDPILVCNEDHRFIVAEQMRKININPNAILLEPFGRNTAAAITVAALTAIKKEEDPVLLVLSSDHEIKNKKRFQELINIGLDYTYNGNLITFGIIPTSPETGYGYIKSEFPFEIENIGGNKILEFIEKPNLEKAKLLVKDKRYTWNSGIFMFKAKTILNEINKHNPLIIETTKAALKNCKNDLDFTRLDPSTFNKCPNISIDNAVMEKTNKGIVIPLDVGWSDIGSWEAVWNASPKDDMGNYIKGKVIAKDINDCYVRSENRLVVGMGLKNLVVIETSDALLIVNKKRFAKN